MVATFGGSVDLANEVLVAGRLRATFVLLGSSALSSPYQRHRAGEILGQGCSEWSSLPMVGSFIRMVSVSRVL